jgi:hypothetical protein
MPDERVPRLKLVRQDMAIIVSRSIQESRLIRAGFQPHVRAGMKRLLQMKRKMHCGDLGLLSAASLQAVSIAGFADWRQPRVPAANRHEDP